MQPKWRQNQQPDSLPVPLADNGDELSSLKKPGPNGLVTVLIALKWWIEAAQVADSGWEAAVLDMTSCLMRMTAPGGGKQKATAEVKSRKKQKVSEEGVSNP